MPARTLLITTALLGLGLAACSPRQEYRGYAFDKARVEQIRPGVQDRDQVAALLGSPSSVSTFTEANDTWYYISRDTETVAFFQEEVLDQHVLAIDFDATGRVRDVRRYALKDGRTIEPVDRETATRGRELGLIEQLFGNIGRFNDQNTRRR